jgi:hypothetical protein
MSKKDEIASGAGLEEQSTDSVFDFLYNDAQRIGSFISQFDAFGHLQNVTSGETASKGARRGFSVKLSGSVPVPGASEAAEGGLTFSREPGETGTEGLTRVYDPLWTNALTLLDYLDERGLIQRDIKKARLGQFVIVSGGLSVLNAAIMPKVFEGGAIEKIVLATAKKNAKEKWGNDQANAALKGPARTKAEAKFLEAAEQAARAGLESLKHIPYSPHCTVNGSDFSVWSSLEARGIVGSVADLSLKHGTEIPGEWHLFGILDALPNPIPAQIVIPISDTPRHFGDAIRNLSNLSRTLVGRGPEAFGMTALLLFRKISQ